MKQLAPLDLHSAVELALPHLLGIFGIGLWAYDFKTGKAWWNDLASRLLGSETEADPERVEGWMERIHPEDCARVQAYLRSVRDAGRDDIDLACRMRRGPDRWHWVRILGRVVERDEAGAPVRAAGALSGLSQRRVAEPEPVDGEEYPLPVAAGIDPGRDRDVQPATADAVRLRRLLSIIESSSDLIATAAPDGRLDYMNRAGRRLLGVESLQPSELGSLQDYSPAEASRNPSEKGLSIALEQGRWLSENRLQRRDGSWIPVSQLILAPRDPATGEVEFLATRCRDLRESRRMRRIKEDLSRSREELELILDAMPALIFYKDTANRILRVNAAVARSLGLPKSRIEGRHSAEFYPHDAERYFQDDLAVIRSGEPRLGIEEPYQGSSGERCCIRTDKVPLKDSSGQVVGVLVMALDISAHKSTEEALRLTQHDLNRAQAVARVGSWRLDLVHDQLTCSTESRRILGQPPGAPLTYESFLEVVHPDDRDRVDRKWRAALRGEPYAVEHRLIVAGRVKWVRENAEFEFDGNGVPLEAFGTTQDITERKQAELALRESETRLRLFIDHAPVALAMFDRDLRYLAASRRWLLDYGLADRDVIGQSHYHIFPEMTERWKEVLRRGLAGEILGDEDRFERSGGLIQWLRWSVRPWHGFDGAVGGIVVFTENITERIQAKEALRRANNHNRALLEASLDPLVVIDPEGRISDVNRATENATGWPRDQLLGTEFAAYFSHPERAREGYRAAFEQGTVRDYSLDLVHRDGWTTPVLYNASVYRDSEGAVEQVLAAARDVTALKRITDLLQGRVRLLDMVEDRSLEEILRASVDEAAALTGSLIGFYHFLDADQETLWLQTWSTRTKAEFCRAEGAGLHYPLSEAGIWADCVRQGRAVIHNDYASIEPRRGLPEGHASVTRELVVPVFRNRRIVAILGVGNKPLDYVDDDVSIVSTFADLAWDLVERKRDREALRESEARYRRIVETASEGIWTMDAEHRTTFVNGRMAAMLGYEPSDILGRPVESFMFPEDIDDHEARMRVRHAGGNELYERRFRRRDGSPLWTLVSADPIHDGESGFEGSFAMLTDISLIKEQQRRLERMAHYDALTGLPNRVLLADRLRMAIAHAQRERRLLAVCYLDLDGFKPVNDTHGHAVGDRLLVEVAERLNQSLRGEDTAARLGGDEFVLLLGDLASQGQAQGLLERLLTSIAEPYELGLERTVRVTLSLGVTLYPLDRADADTLLRHADLAMYQAKQAGRNCIRLFGPEGDSRPLAVAAKRSKR